MEPGSTLPAATRWEVVTATLHDRGDPANGAREESVMQGSEDEARRVFSDTAAQAGARGFAYVALRCDGNDVESWPQATGWTV